MLLHCSSYSDWLEASSFVDLVVVGCGVASGLVISFDPGVDGSC